MLNQHGVRFLEDGDYCLILYIGDQKQKVKINEIRNAQI